MIEERRCSYEVCKLLHEKGFDVKCTDWYWENNINIWKPTHQMACDWLREVHKVLIVIDAYHADHWEGYIDMFEINIYSHASTIIVPNEIAHHTDYTEAVEVALKYVLKNLI